MKRLIIYIFLVVTGITVKAQNQLSLPDAINLAMKNSLDIQLANNSVEANTILNNYGVAGGLPVVTGNITNNELEGEVQVDFLDTVPSCTGTACIPPGSCAWRND